MILYKYLSMENGLRVLRTGLVRFTQPMSFDDPFEASPIIESVFTHEQLLAFVEQMSTDQDFVEQEMEKTLTKIYLETDPAKRIGWTLERCVSVGKQVLKDHISKMNIHLPTYFRNMVLAESAAFQNKAAAQVLQILRTQLGIFCLSATNNHEVLWAKYGDEGFGLAIGFDTNDPFFEGLLQVQYESNRPRVSMPNQEIDVESAKKLATKLISTKSPNWSYEQEYRVVRVVAGADTQAGMDRTGNAICLFRYPTTSVVEVIAGLRAARLDDIRQILSSKQFSEVRIGQVKPSEDQYQLQIHWEAAAA